MSDWALVALAIVAILLVATFLAVYATEGPQAVVELAREEWQTTKKRAKVLAIIVAINFALMFIVLAIALVLAR